MKFRNRPIIIEAFKWTGHDAPMKPQWFRDALAKDSEHLGSAREHGQFHNDAPHVAILTMEGAMRANIGDWIIREGELYPCKPSVFTASYEPAE